MAAMHGSGPFGIYVTWNIGEKTIYRYQEEETRDAKLKSFKASNKVEKAEKCSF